ncbi:MAG: NHLP bacteriocin system secretion protein, partial [Syntrophomonadaceae bacterium]|nr:NHLP bacteriocin system secretion protein [Syntrophomonadaceae bacterium]
ELDQRLKVVSPIGWVALIAIGILIIAALIWGIFGSIADKATGQGIIISSGGITGIIHHANGQITDVSINDGDYIEKGQVIARIQQTELIEEINKYKQDLAAARAIDLDNLELNNSRLNFNIYGKIGEIYKNYQAAKANVETQRTYYNTQKTQAEYELEQARIQYEDTLDKYNKYKTLYENGAVSEKELSDFERQLEVNELAYKTKQQNFIQLPLSQLLEAEATFEAQKQWLKDTIYVSTLDLENNIQKMQRDLMNNSEIIASASGRVLELRVKRGDIVQAGAVICTIAEEREQTDSLEAVVYVPVDQGKKIIPGMEANISPTTVKKEEYGFMMGNVVSVSEYPSSAQGMMLTLGNSELVQQLSGEGAPIEVKVKLVMDRNTPSGYKWSTSQGPSLIIDDGTFCLGEVKVEEKRPISMVVPFIKKILPI